MYVAHLIRLESRNYKNLFHCLSNMANPCRYGSESHSRTSHRSCRLIPRNVPSNEEKPLICILKCQISKCSSMRLEPKGCHRQWLSVVKAIRRLYSAFYYTRNGSMAKTQPSWDWILEQLPLVLQIVHLDIRKPFRGNYTIFFYSNNRYFSRPIHAKLNEESNGVNFKAIPLVYGE